MILAPLLEQTINHLLSIDNDIDTNLLEGKIISVGIDDMPLKPIDWLIVFNAHKVAIISAQTNPEIQIDIVIKLPKKSLLKLIQGTDAKILLQQDELSVVGDAKIAQALFELINQLDLDNEELLTYFSNDIITKGISKGVEFLKHKPPPKFIADGIRSLKSNFLY